MCMCQLDLYTNVWTQICNSADCAVARCLYVRLSVHLSVRQSVIRRYCVKTFFTIGQPHHSSFSTTKFMAIFGRRPLTGPSNSRNMKQVALLSQRGRAMLRVCQYLASVVHYVESKLVLLVSSALSLPLRTNKFRYVLLFSSWSSMLTVINKIH